MLTLKPDDEVTNLKAKLEEVWKTLLSAEQKLQVQVAAHGHALFLSFQEGVEKGTHSTRCSANVWMALLRVTPGQDADPFRPYGPYLY